jgi:hypothetical protein
MPMRVDRRPVGAHAELAAVPLFEMASNPLPHFSSFPFGRALARDLADDGAVHPVASALPVPALELTALARRGDAAVEVFSPSFGHRTIP